MGNSNPDAKEIFQWRYERACRDFTTGGSLAVLKASLKCAGYWGTRLEDEARYQVGLRGVKKVDSYKCGLPARSW